MCINCRLDETDPKGDHSGRLIDFEVWYETNVDLRPLQEWTEIAVEILDGDA